MKIYKYMNDLENLRKRCCITLFFCGAVKRTSHARIPPSAYNKSEGESN